MHLIDRPASNALPLTPEKTGLSPLAEARLRRRLRRSSPSEPWVEAQFATVTEIGARWEKIALRVHDAHAFPPGGAATAMIRCPVCGVFNPPIAFEQGVCLDHRESAGWGRSPSALAIEALQYRNLRVPDQQLPSESPTVLRKEIQRFEKQQAKRAKKKQKSAQKKTGG